MSNVKVTSSQGFQHQLVKIAELIPTQNMARCLNPKNNQEFQVGLTQRHYMAWPQVGEYWILSKNMGPWDLTVKITDVSAPAVTGAVTAGSALASVITSLSGLGLIQNQTTVDPPVTWHTPTYGAHWADPSGGTVFGGFGGGHGLRYTITKQNELWLYGLAVASTSAGTTIFTLPGTGGFFNTTNTLLGTYTKTNGATPTTSALAVTTTGAVIVSGTPANGDVYLLNAKLPLATLP